MNAHAKETRALKVETRRLFVEAVDSLHESGTGDVVFGGMVEELSLIHISEPTRPL